MPLPLRVCIGCSVLLALLAIDLRRCGWASQRLREYMFLTSCLLLGMLFCVLADSVTSRISPEYFSWGKLLGTADFGTKVLLLALSAGWPAGLVLGAVLLAANSLGKPRPLSIRRLLNFLMFPGSLAILFALLGALLFSADPFTESQNLPSWSASIKQRFLIVQGMHLGAYMGGTLGLVFAVVSIIRLRFHHEHNK